MEARCRCRRRHVRGGNLARHQRAALRPDPLRQPVPSAAAGVTPAAQGMVAGPGIIKRPLQVGRAETGPTWAAAHRRSAQTRIRSGTGAGPGLPYSGPRLARVSEVNAGESPGPCRRSCRARPHQRLDSTGSEVPGRNPDIEAVTRSNPVSLPHPEHHMTTNPVPGDGAAGEQGSQNKPAERR